jgi:hypothetical protein
MSRKTIVADTLAILLSVAVIVFSSSSVRRAGGNTVEIQANGVSSRYLLSEDRRVEATGSLGVTVVEIKAGKARIVESPCDNKTCTKMGPVTKDGGYAACLPNNVLVTLVGDGGTEVDDVSN